MLLFAAIIASNAYFLISWARNIVPMIIDTLRRRWTHLSYKNRLSAPDKLSNEYSITDKHVLGNLSVSDVMSI